MTDFDSRFGFDRSEPYPYEEMDVDVDTGAWAQASGDEKIGTLGLGPCVGIALFDPASHTGFVSHSNSFDLDTPAAMISAIKEQGIDFTQSHVWVSGGEAKYDEAVDDDDMVARLEESRQKSVELLQAAGVTDDNMDVTWVEGEYTSANMVLDCETGRCDVIFEQSQYSDSFNDEDSNFPV